MLAQPQPDNVAPSGVELARMFARELSGVGTMVAAGNAPICRAARSRYQLGDRVGQSGITEVFRGTLTGAEGFVRDVVIERVLPGAPERAARFVDAALLASQLVHPNIVQVLDFDRDADGRYFLVSELVAGRDLVALRQSGPLPASIIILIMTETLRGLAYAHDAPVVHGTLSPRNVLLSWQGDVKVADFGASTGEPLDACCDLSAIGELMWELLAELPRVPPDLEAVAMKLLQRDPNDRYVTARQAIADLINCRDVSRDGRGELVRLLAERFRGVVARPADAPSRIPYLVASLAAAAAGWLAACSY